MQHLWTAWQEIAERIKGADRILFLSDFDGTLTPIADSPDLAELPEDTRHWLRSLAGSPRVEVAVISGRAIPDLKGRVSIEGITYAGNHGLELMGPAGTFVHPAAEEARPVMGRLCRDLSRAAAPFSGVIIEDKGLTLSVHYRLLHSAMVGQFRGVFHRVVEGDRSAGVVVITTGKMVYEIRPDVGWDKGRAVEMLLGPGAAASRTDPLAMFLGDDETDEDGFRAIERRGGISVFVGERDEARSAEYFLKSPGEVTALLQKLCRAAGAG